MGDILRNPDLARTLRAIAAQGPDAFYKGDIAKNTAAFLKANGGIITEADLAAMAAFEDTPVHVNYRGVEVYECPPNSQGYVMLEALNILEGYNLKEMGRNSGPYLHAVTEALKLSFADRNAYVGDPKFVPNIPMAAAAVEGIRGRAPLSDRPESRHRRRAGARRSARDETDDGRSGAGLQFAADHANGR